MGGLLGGGGGGGGGQRVCWPPFSNYWGPSPPAPLLPTPMIYSLKLIYLICASLKKNLTGSANGQSDQNLHFSHITSIKSIPSPFGVWGVSSGGQKPELPGKTIWPSACKTWFYDICAAEAWTQSAERPTVYESALLSIRSQRQAWLSLYFAYMLSGTIFSAAQIIYWNLYLSYTIQLLISLIHFRL